MFAMDFGTADDATAMYGILKADKGGLAIDVGNYVQTTAFGARHISGINAYAHFGKYYFEINLANYTDETAAINQAETFLEEFQQKAK